MTFSYFRKLRNVIFEPFHRSQSQEFFVKFKKLNILVYLKYDITQCNIRPRTLVSIVTRWTWHSDHNFQLFPPNVTLNTARRKLCHVFRSFFGTIWYILPWKKSLLYSRLWNRRWGRRVARKRVVYVKNRDGVTGAAIVGSLYRTAKLPVITQGIR